MSDRELRELERRWRASGSEQDRERWLQARARSAGLPTRVLLTQDALRQRGAPWARPRGHELAREHADSGTAWAALGRLLQEAFGPLVPHHARRYPPPTLTAEALGLEVSGAIERAEGLTRALLELHTEWWRGELDRAQACARLAHLVADTTYTDDAWYYDVEGWTAEFFFTESGPSTSVEHLTELCFTSWVLREGDPKRFGNAMALAWIRDHAAARYPDVSWGEGSAALLPVVPEGEGREALLPHLAATLELDWAQAPVALAARLDAADLVETQAQERYQDACDGPSHSGDATRLERFATALATARAAADGRRALTFDLLAAIQADVLGLDTPAPFRLRPALARDGAQVYAWFPGLESLLREKIRADLADDAHPIVQAGRLYLDLIYAHPFDDGNARAARLALELVLRRAGLPTPDLEPLVRLEKRAGDVTTYRAFVAAIADGVERSAQV